MKNKSILLFLPVAVLSVGPAFADKLPHAAMEQSANSFSLHHHPNGNSLQDGANVQNFGRGTFNDAMAGSPLIVFGEGGKALAVQDLLSFKPGKNDSEGHFIDLSLKHSDKFGVGSAKDPGKHNPKDVGVGGSPAPAVAVPEPGSFALVLFGVGVLGVLRYRRN